ncbi:FlgD immunoglobulin-like domain containing protein [Sulfuricurvum sp.]|uniref:FlgD immunoglobulin-like domain containing protein n=1 Tax=Sulfuricurvum sp. TaxID=2025608 RepID=UPI0026290333|nr:FlgD immunoglobulin-like domain containing protein [Sulfuricurvum sp.]MDD3597978.1 FlgD immunoglobulin-like domain containing protein [Sulfuricurvum sp.]MDD4883276.1 FlgD immunoglobulin-like domain containing protein [Sulfuricurvum sp.]
MAIDAYGNYTTGTAYTDTSTKTSTKTTGSSALGKDDFLNLLMVELKYQDPTEPMDSEKILTQTSQLATLESAENTNKALESLTAALTTSMQYSGISAIGKMADTGSNAIQLEEGSDAKFELYLPEAATDGKINILDNKGNVLKTITMEATDAGVSQYTWDGTNNAGKELDAGIYYVEATYNKADETSGTTRVGLYPIEAIRYEGGTTYAKLGSSYVDFSKITEITNN